MKKSYHKDYVSYLLNESEHRKLTNREKLYLKEHKQVNTVSERLQKEKVKDCINLLCQLNSKSFNENVKIFSKMYSSFLNNHRTIIQESISNDITSIDLFRECLIQKIEESYTILDEDQEKFLYDMLINNKYVKENKLFIQNYYQNGMRFMLNEGIDPVNYRAVVLLNEARKSSGRVKGLLSRAGKRTREFTRNTGARLFGGQLRHRGKFGKTVPGIFPSAVKRASTALEKASKAYNTGFDRASEKLFGPQGDSSNWGLVGKVGNIFGSARKKLDDKFKRHKVLSAREARKKELDDMSSKYGISRNKIRSIMKEKQWGFDQMRAALEKSNARHERNQAKRDSRNNAADNTPPQTTAVQTAQPVTAEIAPLSPSEYYTLRNRYLAGDPTLTKDQIGQLRWIDRIRDRSTRKENLRGNRDADVSRMVRTLRGEDEQDNRGTGRQYYGSGTNLDALDQIRQLSSRSRSLGGDSRRRPDDAGSERRIGRRQRDAGGEVIDVIPAEPGTPVQVQQASAGQLTPTPTPTPTPRRTSYNFEDEPAPRTPRQQGTGHDPAERAEDLAHDKTTKNLRIAYRTADARKRKTDPSNKKPLSPEEFAKFIHERASSAKNSKAKAIYADLEGKIVSSNFGKDSNGIGNNGDYLYKMFSNTVRTTQEPSEPIYAYKSDGGILGSTSAYQSQVSKKTKTNRRSGHQYSTLVYTDNSGQDHEVYVTTRQHNYFTRLKSKLADLRQSDSAASGTSESYQLFLLRYSPEVQLAESRGISSRNFYQLYLIERVKEMYGIKNEKI